ncbi:mannose-1-phosphate guanylyltransferase/mannose-6-phosphate isomerase [Arenicella xantha]|uniref:mannose-1-phosphate guanylyltransferase n=1 Tax=Arenicella xantha TaxID=644221 RepID=A0A395JPJ3_9GAMM|nr:mannose-1-phosphate guanylyltransferase/mannose-6-phosphate isomerase [Arenicella xantha]RBP51498.1 mannose-1-phosphate guanylyltransferase/mannose-1-phosphate guanylyltransferase/mannose-6-phosphate isomerase [Arenicella xantha]
MSSIVPVILSGGSGSRLWPSSRALYPKQFLRLVSDKTMLQETVLRLDGLADLEAPIVVANHEHRFLVAEQLRECTEQKCKIILEPVAKNTAPAIALAALSLEADGRADDVILVLPADHVIEDVAGFQRAVESGRSSCVAGKLVTFGIVPSAPETGYGYIRRGEEVSLGVYEVGEFVEKPNLETAQVYIDSGAYFWNSGIFMFTAASYLEQLQRNEPEMVEVCRESLRNASDDLDFIRIDKDEFEQCASNSIDYAVMENTLEAVTIGLDVGWNDIGSWSALWQQLDKDGNGNVLRGDVMTRDVHNSLIISEKKLIACLGMDNFILVETDDSILLASKERVQEVKKIVEEIAELKRSEANIHRKVYRPWGFYDSIENELGFQVKRLVVYPGAQLSLQKHYHRAEHWVVVKGTAEVVNGDQELLLRVNESTYIPIGAKHQLRNPGKVQLELIEVQSGDYLGEDDIVRYEDIYGRLEVESN